MWDEYISKLNFTALCIIKPKVILCKEETLSFQMITYKEGFENEA